MKVQKGEPGYIKAQKTKYMIYSIIEFSIVIAFVIFGILKTGSRLNYFTIIAIVGCLPASKMLVEYITMFPHKGIESDKAKDIKEKTTHLTTAFDLVITGNEKVMPLQAVVISGNTVYGYTISDKTDTNLLTAYLKEMFKNNKYDPVNVKIFREYPAFISRADGLNRIAEVSGQDYKEYEVNLRNLLLSTAF